MLDSTSKVENKYHLGKPINVIPNWAAAARIFAAVIQGGTYNGRLEVSKDVCEMGALIDRLQAVVVGAHCVIRLDNDQDYDRLLAVLEDASERGDLGEFDVQGVE